MSASGRNLPDSDERIWPKAVQQRSQDVRDIEGGDLTEYLFRYVATSNQYIQL